jgi:hypothetical protein
VLENFMFPRTVAEADGLIFQQDGAPVHFVALYTLLWTIDFLADVSAVRAE